MYLRGKPLRCTISFNFPPWDSGLEPDEGNIGNWLDNLRNKSRPAEDARWNQSNIDTLFYAGEQRFVNQYFNFTPQANWQNFHFNICQQPINMVTGYQRQHRKSIQYLPSENADSETTDQYTKVVMHANHNRQILEKFSTACEQAAISGMVMIQPYLDYTDDPVNGTLDLKVWEYNSFLVDQYFRCPDMSDANFVWTQQYLSKTEADTLFPEQMARIVPMMGAPQRYSRFYFLPENYNMARNDLLVMNYVWYKWRRKKKMIYNRQTQETFDFGDTAEAMQELIQTVGSTFEVIEIEVPTWKMAVTINDQLMFQGLNPLGFDECPFIPVYWNYDPHLAYYDLRVRSLTRTMRDAQYLTNRRIILNHDISESSINSGWKYREDGIANPENLRYAGQGKDIIIKDTYGQTPMDDVIQKIQPNAVPASDIQLAEQMIGMIFQTSGVQLENFGLGEHMDKAQSGLAIALKQGAGLMVLQKYFDQWDVSLKLLGALELKIVQNNWSPAKIARMIGETPTPYFFSKMFAKCKTVVEEGLDTPTQRQLEFKQMLDLNELLGGVIPAHLLLKNATVQGKKELMEALGQQQEHAAEMEQQKQLLEQAVLDAKLKESYSKSAGNIATARERHSRSESNVGLYEERMSEISKNHSSALKDKAEALEKILELVARYGEIEAGLRSQDLKSLELDQFIEENQEKSDARQTSLSNRFSADIVDQVQPNQQGLLARGLK